MRQVLMMGHLPETITLSTIFSTSCTLFLNFPSVFFLYLFIRLDLQIRLTIISLLFSEISWIFLNCGLQLLLQRKIHSILFPVTKILYNLLLRSPQFPHIRYSSILYFSLQDLL